MWKVYRYTPRPMGAGRPLALVAAGGVVSLLLLGIGHAALGYALFIASFTGFCLTTPLSLNVQIGIGAALAVAFGIVPGSGVETVHVVGRVFIAMLKMLIAPMILLSITAGIAQMATSYWAPSWSGA